MLMSWHSLLPPIMVIIGAIITRKIHPALAIGVITACLVTSSGSFSLGWDIGINAFFNTATNSENLYLYGFLSLIGVLVAIYTTTGCAAACARAITKKIRTAQTAQYSSMLVSSLLFIDDYLSILTTGYIMRSLTDRLSIARVKLAYLVHSLSGPIVILVPISSWVATIIAYIDQAGVDVDSSNQTIRILADPFFVYLNSIPFIFYSFLTIISAWFIIHKKISFGPMQQYEKEAVPIPEMFTSTDTRHGIWELVLPLATLIFGTLIGLPLAGGYWLLGGKYSFIESIKYNDHPFLVMLCASLMAVIVSITISCINNSLAKKEIIKVIYRGLHLMFPAISMVFLATTLSDLLANNVGTGQYLASLMIGSISMAFIPVMFFIISVICTIATGSSWGNFAIMIPIAIPMLTALSGLPLPINPKNLLTETFWS